MTDLILLKINKLMDSFGKRFDSSLEEWTNPGSCITTSWDNSFLHPCKRLFKEYRLCVCWYLYRKYAVIKPLGLRGGLQCTSITAAPAAQSSGESRAFGTASDVRTEMPFPTPQPSTAWFHIHIF